jgi:PST family polysaccharide transporter
VQREVDAPRSLRHTTARGVGWVLAATGVQRVASLGAQLLLGLLLTAEDFGVYAIASGVAAAGVSLSDGGVRRWLAQRPPGSFSRDGSVGFAAAGLCASVMAVAVIASSGRVASAYGEPEVQPVLVVIGLSLLLGTYAIVGTAKLQVDLRFRALAGVTAWSALLRYGSLVAFAAAGMGAMSFALPIMLTMTFESLATARATRFRPNFDKEITRDALNLLVKIRWIVAGGLFTGLSMQIDYAVLGMVAATATVGQYYFAYQLSWQTVVLFTEALRRVVVPVFAQANEPGQRERGLRAGAGAIALAAPLILLPVPIAGWLEDILWRGRWDESVPAIQILTLAMPIVLMAGFVDMLVLSRALWKLFCTLLFARAVAVAVAALVGGLATPEDPTGLAVAVATALAGTCAVLSRWTLGRLGEDRRAIVQPTAAIVALAAVAALTTVVARDAVDGEALQALVGAATFSVAAVGLFATVFRSVVTSAQPVLSAVPFVQRALGRSAT